MSKSGKTKIFDVCGVAVTSAGGDDLLGYVQWFGRWRKYAFFPRPGSVFEKDCLRLIADFCERHTKTHHAGLRAKRKNKGTLK